MVTTEKEDLRFVAEALLAMCAEDRECPVTDDFELDRRAAAARKREHLWTALVSRRRNDPLLEAECRDVFSRAKLTDLQAHTFAMRLDGFSFEEIGRWNGTSRQSAQRTFVGALRRIGKAWRSYRYRGISEVYRWEVARAR